MLTERLLKALGISVADEPSPNAAALQIEVPHRDRVSLAQQAFLIGIDPVKGTLSDTTRYAVAAALLVELAHEGRLEVSPAGRATRMTLSRPEPLGDPDLDDAMRLIDVLGPDQKVAGQVSVLATVGPLRGRLVAEGLVVEESERRLGLRTATRLRTTPAAGRDGLTDRLRNVLVTGATPDERTALLVAALDGCVVPWKLVVAKGELKEARKRAKAIGEDVGPDARALIAAVSDKINTGGDFASST